MQVDSMTSRRLAQAVIHSRGVSSPRSIIDHRSTANWWYETLVIWAGEFGRLRMGEKGEGRDHNPTGFTIWMASGGMKGGQSIGTTDDLGLIAVEDRLHVHDFHARS
jgi:uncharacterized protein (DUF1501 family)